jgi:hypothetical protein
MQKEQAASSSVEVQAAQDLECVGERIPCWDTQRRVWQALDLLLTQPRSAVAPLPKSTPAAVPTTGEPSTAAPRPMPRRQGPPLKWAAL